MENKEYIINRLNWVRRKPQRKEWSSIDALSVDCYPWNGICTEGTLIPNEFIPRMEARLFHTNEAIHILMETQERYPRATYHDANSPVCKDSCQEFFLHPCPEDDGRYFNFEFNPWGTMHLGIGCNRYDRIAIKQQETVSLHIRSRIVCLAEIEPSLFRWSIDFLISFDFIQRFFSAFRSFPGITMRGNIYKCGDDTIYPHYGCWNPIVHATPDFHRPEQFGKLILQ